MWQYSSSEVEGRICPSGQSVGVGTTDMRSDLFHGPRAGRSVSAENFDIIANEADGADSGVIPASAPALELSLSHAPNEQAAVVASVNNVSVTR